MERQSLRQPTAVGLVALLVLVLASGVALAQERPTTPEPGVPEIFTLEGKFVRIAYNDEGYVSLGYQLANRSVGQEWMRLEIGVTSRTKNQKLKREAFSIQTPDNQRIQMATQDEYTDAYLKALDMRAEVSTTSPPRPHEPAESASSRTPPTPARWPSTSSRRARSAPALAGSTSTYQAASRTASTGSASSSRTAW